MYTHCLLLSEHNCPVTTPQLLPKPIFRDYFKYIAIPIIPYLRLLFIILAKLLFNIIGFWHGYCIK